MIFVIVHVALAVLLNGCGPVEPDPHETRSCKAKVDIAGIYNTKIPHDSEHILHVVDNSWTPCSRMIEHYVGPINTTFEVKENAGAIYTLGEPLLTWGCACVGIAPTMWLDNASNILY